MAVYFVYTYLNTSNMGGVFPKTRNENIKLGQGVYDKYYIGEALTEDDLSEIKDYIISYIDYDTYVGFSFIGKDTKIVEDPNNPGQFISEPLTTTEIAQRNKAENYILKLKLRNKINNQNGDLIDIISDMNKRIDLLERLLMRTCYYLYQDLPIDQIYKDKYLPMIQDYITSVDTGTLIMRADLEDSMTLYTNLKTRFNNLTNLINTEYLSLKK